MKNIKKLMLSVLPEKFGIRHFSAKTPVPEWALKEMDFRSIARTSDELSMS